MRTMRMLSLVCLCLGLGACPGTALRTQAKMEWVPVHELTVEGQAFTGLAAPFDRLPARAQKTVRKQVWDLSRHAAGLCVRFRSDARSLRVRWELTEARLAMPHMPATGVSGLDLYMRHEGRWRWAATAQPRKFPDNESGLVRNLDGELHEYQLYLPLYNGVKRVEIGLTGGAKLEGFPRSERRRPIVFYGTSITHGACASRPGMTHVAILGRRLDRPVINLGFSGNGRLEQEVGDLVREIDAAVYVLDCLPNLNGKQVAERLVPFVRALRKARPETPIVIVEDRRYPNGFVFDGRRKRNLENWKACRAGFEQLQNDGLKRLFYLEGAALLGEDGEDTVDGSHPTDLGFMRQARAMEPVLRRALASRR